MAVVWIPSLMRDLTDGHDKVIVAGATLRQIVNSLDALYPGIKARICEGDELRPNVSAAVDGEATQVGLLQPVQPESEIHFVPAISGG